MPKLKKKIIVSTGILEIVCPGLKKSDYYFFTYERAYVSLVLE